MSTPTVTGTLVKAHLLSLGHDPALVEEYVSEAEHQEGVEVWDSEVYEHGDLAVITVDYELYRDNI